jgi:hypothetical protein
MFVDQTGSLDSKIKAASALRAYRRPVHFLSIWGIACGSSGELRTTHAREATCRACVHAIREHDRAFPGRALL